MKEKINYTKNKNKFTNEMLNDTLKYQKQYGFDIGEDNVAWNNEADAFRHTYMQSVLAQRYGMPSTKAVSYFHEKLGNLHNQDPRESNMDLWNNRQGQQIFYEIKREYPNFKSLPENQQKDIIAKKVVQRMRNGQLITGLEDTRKYRDSNKLPFIPTRGSGGVKNNGVPLGFATDIDIEELAKQLGLQSFSFDIPQQKLSTFSNYTNPLTGNNRIFTREDVGAMTPAEFARHEKEIDAQIESMGGVMPTNDELQREAMTGSGVVYVNSYTRSDGTQVKGYYRSK